MPTFTSELITNLSPRQSPKGHEDRQSPEQLSDQTAEVDQKKIDNITELFGKCFEIQSPTEIENDVKKIEVECLETKSDDDDTESETKMWQFATKEIESAKHEKTEEKSVKGADIILNTGADDDFGTVIRRPKNCILTPPESKDWKIEVQSNPVVDEQESFINIGINENSRIFNPYGDDDGTSYSGASGCISPNGNNEPIWQTELRSPADGGDYSNMTERNIGDGLATPDDIEPRKNYLDSESDEEDSNNEQYQVWKNVNAVFAGLNADTIRRPVNFNNNNDAATAQAKTAASTAASRGRARSRVHDRPIYVDLTYVPETSVERLADFSSLIRARTYVLSSDMAQREVFVRLLQGMKKWINPEIETTIVSLGNEEDADRWSFEYGELLQELNCIVVTSGQVLVDGQAVKACKIDLSCSASEV